MQILIKKEYPLYVPLDIKYYDGTDVKQIFLIDDPVNPTNVISATYSDKIWYDKAGNIINKVIYFYEETTVDDITRPLSKEIIELKKDNNNIKKVLKDISLALKRLAHAQCEIIEDSNLDIGKLKEELLKIE